MKINSTHNVYKQADVSCGTPQLVIMLYDGAIRYLKEASTHLRAGRMGEKGKAVDAAMECISELRCGLNRDAGGDAAQTLDRMYDFLSTKIVVGNAERNPEQFDQVVRSLESLRQAWIELFDRLRVEGKLSEEKGQVLTPAG
jgi:flagellar secretion chaperone FliS